MIQNADVIFYQCVHGSYGGEKAGKTKQIYTVNTENNLEAILSERAQGNCYK